jgi:hypothetical protein
MIKKKFKIELEIEMNIKDEDFIKNSTQKEIEDEIQDCIVNPKYDECLNDMFNGCKNVKVSLMDDENENNN